jgi:ABC-2 type transport system ATP-binding protein
MPDSTVCAPHPAAIEIEGLHKRYGEAVAVNGIDLEVRRGEIVGLIGPDGAGKTTSMRILCGLLHPDEGRTSILGLSSQAEARKLKQHLGYMPQRFSLYPDLSVAENIRFFADMFGVSGVARKKREEELLEFSRLGDFRGRKAGQLSGGMKQKLALTCTLIHTPDVLVLDEPTTGVDPVSRQEFWRILRKLAGDGLALLVSTPYMDEADLCDRVMLMHRGRILLHGSPEEIPSRFPRTLLSIHGSGLRAARAALIGWEAVTVHRFGDRLHVAVDDEAQLGRIRERLSGVDVEIRPARPTTEDVFVELTTTGHAPGGKATRVPADHAPGGKATQVPADYAPGGKATQVPAGHAPGGKATQVPDDHAPGGKATQIPADRAPGNEGPR